ncbi:MAG: SpoIID/LytB domain-containing protein [Armatimonadetes bacterium]|nr:SpoIID/LytB domain-containing protein [Armatimonadota bacterium]
MKIEKGSNLDVVQIGGERERLSSRFRLRCNHRLGSKRRRAAALHMSVPKVSLSVEKSIRIFFVCLAVLFASRADADVVRIGLIREFKLQPEVSIRSLSEFYIADPSGHILATCAAQEEIKLAAKDGSVEFSRPNGASAFIGTEAQITTSLPDSAICITNPAGSTREYRGKIIVKGNERGLSFVNVLDIEDYLLGVIPSEMPFGFNLEALKAQAVAARTYAWSHLGRHSKIGYDLCDSTDCQVYLGAMAEKPSPTQAVIETLGLVATYHGRLIQANYCGDCGGVTQHGGKPYLISVSDRSEDGGPDYCEHERHSWTRSWPVAEFEILLRKLLPDLSGLKSISTGEADGTGRVREVRIEAEKGLSTIPALSLRNLLGNMVIRSTVFATRIEDGCVIFEGRGYGHGVGMCQFGANGLAASPNNYTFDRILKHYYQGIEIVPISSIK